MVVAVVVVVGELDGSGGGGEGWSVDMMIDV